MNILLKLSAILFVVMAQSCNSTKTATIEKDAETNTSKEMDTKLVKEGYIAGTVNYRADSPCTYVLIDAETNIKYDPINMDEEKFMSFKKNAIKVYFKYQALRRMNRCEDAQPILILDIQAKED